MLYNTKALKCTGTTDSEYNTTESNSITTSNHQEQATMQEENIITCTENLLEFTAPYGNKEVTIHLEFPEHENEEVTNDFINRLKEIYLKKIKLQSMQGENPALYSQSTNEEEDKANG